MAQLYMITLPGLNVSSDWVAVHDRLLDDFPAVTDVLPTTMSATILVVYEERPEIDAWLDAVGEAVLSRRLHSGGPTAGTTRSATA